MCRCLRTCLAAAVSAVVVASGPAQAQWEMDPLLYPNITNYQGCYQELSCHFAQYIWGIQTLEGGYQRVWGEMTIRHELYNGFGGAVRGYFLIWNDQIQGEDEFGDTSLLRATFTESWWGGHIAPTSDLVPPDHLRFQLVYGEPGTDWAADGPFATFEQVNVSLGVVPEPATYFLLLTAAIPLAILAGRRRSAVV